MTQTLSRLVVKPRDLVDFSGGLNLRDAAGQLADNESPDMWNVTLTERGGVEKRLGYAQWNSSATGSAIFQYGFYSATFDLLYWQSGAGLYSQSGSGALTLRRTWGSSARIQMIDFAGSLFAIHPTDGLYVSTNGTVFSAVVAASGSVPTNSNLLTTWQNKLWISGDTANPSRVYFSAPGDATKWATADGGGSNDLREGDNRPITALYGASGADQQTNPALIAFKRDSHYRVIDSTTGEYRTIDQAVGAAGGLAVTAAYGRVVFLGPRGLYVTTGEDKAIPVGQKLEPLWQPSQINHGQLSLIALGQRQGRVYISLPRSGSTANDLAIEYHPLVGWVAPRSDAMACYVNYSSSDETLLGGHPTTVGRAYQLLSGGSDTGSSITSRFQTKWFELNDGYECRVHRVRATVGGNVTLGLRRNYGDSDRVSYALTPPAVASTWNGSTWGGTTWAGNDSRYEVDRFPRLLGKAFSFRITESSSLTRTGLKLIGAGTAPTIGAWSLYGLLIDYTPLGLS